MFTDMANFSYTELFLQMNEEEIMEANCALDIANAQIQAEMKKRKRH